MIKKGQLVKVVGAGNVSYEQATLDKYSRDMSFVNTVRPACVVKPRNADDIKQLVNLANKTLTPLV
jgi:FAD/FMN-containing dehydrogenase